MSLDQALADLVRTAVAAELAPLLARLEQLESGPQVLTVTQTADRLQTSESTVRRLIADGHLPVLDLGDRRLTRIPSSALNGSVPRLRSVGGAA